MHFSVCLLLPHNVMWQLSKWHLRCSNHCTSPWDDLRCPRVCTGSLQSLRHLGEGLSVVWGCGQSSAGNSGRGDFCSSGKPQAFPSALSECWLTGLWLVLSAVAARNSGMRTGPPLCPPHSALFSHHTALPDFSGFKHFSQDHSWFSGSGIHLSHGRGVFWLLPRGSCQG